MYIDEEKICENVAVDKKSAYIIYEWSLSTCQHCDFTSYSSIIVKRHTVLNHGFFCKICDFTTKSKSEFLQHRKTHPITLKCSRFEECGFEGFKVELVFKELNHLAAILHVYAGVWFLWNKKILLFFKKKKEILLHF